MNDKQKGKAKFRSSKIWKSFKHIISVKQKGLEFIGKILAIVGLVLVTALAGLVLVYRFLGWILPIIAFYVVKLH